MLDKKERSVLFPGHNVNFSSAGPGASQLQNTDFTPSSYFFNINILEETSTKRKFLNLDGKNHPGVSSVLTGNNQYYETNDFSLGRQAEYDKINKVLFSSQRQPYFQQKEFSFLPETHKEEVSKLRDIDHIGCARESEPTGFRSEYSHDLLRTFLHSQDKQQHGMVIPRLPVVLESSSYADVPLGNEKLKNSSYNSKEFENIYLGKQEETIIEPYNRPLVERNSCVNASLSSERSTDIGDGFSANIDEQTKSANRRVSPVISEKIWDGSLKLNTSTTVSAVAFFKSGEKLQDLNWPANIEIKGKVRLQAFEKFIQELPRSRNRALMVISLCWKDGSSRTGLTGMMEVANGYREAEKVGFAQIPRGIDLYVCPRSETIITILAKHGFLKGIAAVEDDQDSLIGCVVWRKIQSSTAKDTVLKKTLIEDQPLNSTGLSNQGMNPIAMDARECGKKQVMPSETELKAGTSSPLTDTRSMIIENKATVSTSNSNSSILHYNDAQTITSSIPLSCPQLSAHQKTSEKPSLNLTQENMKPADTIPLAKNSGPDEAVLVSDSSTQFVSPSQMAHVFMQGSSFSNSGPCLGLRPLIPVDSSNFQFQPQMAQNTNSSVRNDSNCGGKNLAPSFQETQASLPRPLPLPFELLRRLIQSNDNGVINEGMLQDENYVMHHIVTRGPSNVSETREPSLPQIQKTCDSSSGGRKEQDDQDDDDLPEFDFNSACGEPEAPIIRFHEKSFLQTMSSSKSFVPALPSKSSNSNEGLCLAENYGKFISEKTPSTKDYHLTSQPNCLKETMDLGNNTKHGFALERKSLWDDDDDDMPEWCPPDLELPKQPLPSTATSARLLSGSPLSPPDTKTPLSYHPRRSHDLEQNSKPGLLGPCPTSESPEGGGPVQTRSIGEFARISSPKLQPRSHRRDSFRPHAPKFHRRPAPYAADGRRRRS